MNKFIECPLCECQNVHVVDNGKQNARGRVIGHSPHGDQGSHTIQMYCEGGCAFDLVFSTHKGDTSVAIIEYTGKLYEDVEFKLETK